MKTLNDYIREVILRGCVCKWCEEDPEAKVPEKVLWAQPLQHYEHTGGYPVEGFRERQWLSITCPICEYQWALHKLGVNPGPDMQFEVWMQELRHLAVNKYKFPAGDVNMWDAQEWRQQYYDGANYQLPEAALVMDMEAGA